MKLALALIATSVAHPLDGAAPMREMTFTPEAWQTLKALKLGAICPPCNTPFGTVGSFGARRSGQGLFGSQAGLVNLDNTLNNNNILSPSANSGWNWGRRPGWGFQSVTGYGDGAEHNSLIDAPELAKGANVIGALNRQSEGAYGY